MLLNFPGSICDLAVKIYVCNEVVMICVQNGVISDDTSSSCEAPSSLIAGSTISTEGENLHSSHHRDDMSLSLIPCNVARKYSLIKDRVLPHIYKTQNAYINSKDSLKCVICVGYGFSASIASCLASDIGKKYYKQMEFLGRDKKAVDVDFVGFSTPPSASRGHWDSITGCIDRYISVNDCGYKSSHWSHMVEKPSVLHVPIGDMNRRKKIESILKIRSGKKNDEKQEEMDISEYISEIQKKILLAPRDS